MWPMAHSPERLALYTVAQLSAPTWSRWHLYRYKRHSVRCWLLRTSRSFWHCTQPLSVPLFALMPRRCAQHCSRPLVFSTSAFSSLVASLPVSSRLLSSLLSVSAHCISFLPLLSSMPLPLSPQLYPLIKHVDLLFICKRKYEI